MTKLYYQLILHIIFVTSIWFYPWYYSFYSFLIYILFGGIGISIVFHRYYAHGAYKELPFWLKHLGLIFGTLASHGSIIEWVLKHRKHHSKSDTKDDPHSPVHVNPFKLYWTALKYDDINLVYARRVITDPVTRMYHKYYWYIIALYSTILLLFGYEYFLFGYVGAAVITWIFTGLGIGILSHLYGYVSYKTKDNSKNNLLIGLLSFGEGYQNNHHHDPKNPIHGKHWYELDPLGSLILKLL